MKRVVFGLILAVAASAASLLAQSKPAGPPAGPHRIALLDSSVNTRTFMGLHYTNCVAPDIHLGADEYKRYFLGWQYVLSGEPNNALVAGLQPSFAPYNYQVIQESSLTNGDLDSFDILILSNDVSLDDNENKAVQSWTQKGGRLIATYGSGYKDIVTDGKQDDNLKVQSGGTSGIPNLWGDPMT